MSAHYVRQTDELAALCDRAAASGRIGLDTEFIRDKTYFSQLALIQIGVEDQFVLLDPLSSVRLDPLLDLLLDETVVKVLHAATQDLEIFYRLTGEPPRTVFDTQVAAAMCGLGLQVSYGAAVETLLGETISKGQRYTDWLKRPLSEAQERYALADVEYLFPLHDLLQARVAELGRLEPLAEELEALCAPERYTTSLADVSRRLKGTRGLDARARVVLEALVAWREDEAQRRDIPRRWVLGDDPLVAVARSQPHRMRELTAIRGIGKGIARHGHVILDVIADAQRAPLPEVEEKKPKPRLTEDQTTAADFVKSLVRTLCRDADIAPNMVASSSEIESFVARWYSDEDVADHPLLHGWRGAIIGERVRGFLNGELGVRLSPDGGVRLVEAAP